MGSIHKKSKKNKIYFGIIVLLGIFYRLMGSTDIILGKILNVLFSSITLMIILNILLIQLYF